MWTAVGIGSARYRTLMNERAWFGNADEANVCPSCPGGVAGPMFGELMQARGRANDQSSCICQHCGSRARAKVRSKIGTLSLRLLSPRIVPRVPRETSGVQRFLGSELRCLPEREKSPKASPKGMICRQQHQIWRASAHHPYGTMLDIHIYRKVERSTGPSAATLVCQNFCVKVAARGCTRSAMKGSARCTGVLKILVTGCNSRKCSTAGKSSIGDSR